MALYNNPVQNLKQLEHHYSYLTRELYQLINKIIYSLLPKIFFHNKILLSDLNKHKIKLHIIH